jgi:hypothetical protein
MEPVKIDGHPLRPWIRTRFQTNPIVDRFSQPLLATQILLRGLYADMAKQELDLFQLSACLVAETRTRSTQVVRRQFVEADTCCKFTNNPPYNLFSHSLAPDCTCSVHAPKQSSGLDVSRSRPRVYGCLDPVRDWHRSHMASLTNQVNNGPMLLSLL